MGEHDTTRWPKIRLKYVATINDEALPESTPPDYDMAYLDISSVDSNGTVSPPEVLSFENAPSRARRIARDGDVIISTVRTYLTAIAPVESPPDNLVVSTGFAVIRPLPDKLSPHFCKYALRSPAFISEVQRLSVGVNYPAINASDLAGIEIPTPPMEQQRAIAAYLDRETARLDVLAASYRELIEQLAEKRRALVAHAVTRGLDPGAPMKDSGVEWLGEIPAHWRVERARWLFSQSTLPVRDDDGVVTCFRDGEVTLRSNRRTEGFTEAVKEIGYQGIRAGQLVLHSMDAFAGAIGVCDSDGKCSPEYIVLDPIDADIYHPYYGLLLREMALRRFIQANCPAVRERAPRIRFSDLKDMSLPVPPEEEQRAIVAYIRAQSVALNSLAAEATTALELLAEHRDALIAEAVAGQVDAPAVMV